MPRVPGGIGEQLFGIGIFVPRLVLNYEFPVNQYNWPAPHVTSLSYPPRIYTQPLGSPNTLLPQIPQCGFQYNAFQPDAFQVCQVALDLISQYSWPAPIPPYRVYAQSYSTPIPILFLASTPYNQEYWPPPLQPYKVYAQSYSTPIPILAALSAQLPFNQYDWPQAKQVFVPTTNRTWVQRASLALTAQPVGAASFASRQIVLPVAQAQSYSSPMMLLTSQRPFNQYDWPVPAAFKVSSLAQRRGFNTTQTPPTAVFNLAPTFFNVF